MRKSKKVRQPVGESEIAPNRVQDQGAHQQAIEPADSASLSRNGPSAQKGAGPSVEDVRDRIAANHRQGPWRPLEHLAQAEAELESHSAALAKLPRPQRAQGSDLLAYQLTRTVNTDFVPNVMAPKLRADTVALFAAFDSSDPVESILNRLLLGMTNSVMECHARAARSDDPNVFEPNLRLATKGSQSIIDLIEALERRRSPKAVVVEKVSVNAGGKAMVGNFEIRKDSARESPTDADSSPPADSKEQD